MPRLGIVENQIINHAYQMDENEEFGEKCDEWVQEQLPTLMAEFQTRYIADLPNYSGKTTPVLMDEFLSDKDGERFYKNCASQMSDIEGVREWGRQDHLDHLRDCLEFQLDEVAHLFVERA